MDLPTGSKAFHRLNPQLFGGLDLASGIRGGTQDPRSKHQDPTRERKLHDDIETLCRLRGWLYCHSRMDAPSTIAVGFPDFAIFMPGGVTVFLECKRPGGKPTTAQLAKLAHARKLGFSAEIVTSMEEVGAAIAVANRWKSICHENPTHPT